ncbi:hypothetical protein V8F20_009768 [Naviculisporaceae sp. PSN 640]
MHTREPGTSSPTSCRVSYIIQSSRMEEDEPRGLSPHRYDDKVVTSGTTARMVLMFMRDLIETQQPRHSFSCPMRECRKVFTEAFSLIQHLLTCPDLLRGGIFDCDKCNAWHQVPTNEKDWEQWTGWRSHPAPAPFQRKRSFSSKMRETFTIRRKDSSRKANASPEPPHIDHGYSLNIRMGSMPLDQQRSIANSVCPEHNVVHPSQRPVPDFLGPQKVIPDLDRNMFWPGVVDDMSDLQSAVSTASIAASSFETSQPASTNTSQTTLYTSAFSNYPPATPSAQSRDSRLPTQPFMFSPQSNFSSEPHSSAMSIDEPMTANEPALSPNELRPVTSNNNHSRWSPKNGTEAAQTLTPVSSACFPMQSPVGGMMAGGASGEITAPTSPCTSAGIEDRNATPGPQYYPMQHASMHQHTISRALSQESMHDDQMSNLYEIGLSDAHNMTTMSPQSPHTHHSMGMHRKNNVESPTEELMCDECQWKPRGVRENLKGYLRKHKNTHKGLRLACEVPGCTKTFSRLDNLKKHKKDKHGMSDDGPSILPSKRVVDEYAEHIEDDPDKRPGTSDSRIRVVMAEDYSMLWPALHF